MWSASGAINRVCQSHARVCCSFSADMLGSGDKLRRSTSRKVTAHECCPALPAGLRDTSHASTLFKPKRAVSSSSGGRGCRYMTTTRVRVIGQQVGASLELELVLVSVSGVEVH